jgi:tRNA/rRNA methyltransferase
MSGEATVRIVLVRPKDSRNVGAVCRAMKTMGLTALSIVPDALIDPVQARALAHHAADVLEEAVLFASLPEALGGAALVAGTTRRRGRDRKYFSVFPEQLAERVCGAGGGEVAVLFGNEETGLTDDELSQCHLAVTIPSSPAFPSLNLSHAVQLVGWEIFRARARAAGATGGSGRPLTPFTPISAAEVDTLASLITRALKAIGFFTLVGSESMAVFWKDILGRAGLSVGEARRLGVTFRKIGGLITGKGIDPGSDPP